MNRIECIKLLKFYKRLHIQIGRQVNQILLDLRMRM